MKKRGTGCIYKQRGSANWWIKYYLNGKAYPEPTGSPDRKVAEKILREKMARKTLNQLKPVADKVKFDDVVALLINDYKINGKRSLDRVEHGLKHLMPFFGGRKVQTITPGLIDAYILERQEQGAANATINREMANLKRAFNLAIEKGKIDQRPFISMLEEDNVRTGFFTAGEFLALRDALPDYLRPIVTFAYYTGWRKQEILTLGWNQVDLQGKTVRLAPGQTKNKKGRVIALDGELLEVIQAQSEKRRVVALPGQSHTLLCPYVFHNNGNPIKDFRSAWKAATGKAGLSGRLFHDLRRTAIKNMVKAGVREKVAMEITGHKTRSVFDRYHIVDEEELREAARKTSEHVRGEGKATVVVPLASRASGQG